MEEAMFVMTMLHDQIETCNSVIFDVAVAILRLLPVLQLRQVYAGMYRMVRLSSTMLM